MSPSAATAKPYGTFRAVIAQIRSGEQGAARAAISSGSPVGTLTEKIRP